MRREHARVCALTPVCQWHRKYGKEAHNQRWLLRTAGLIAAADDISRVLEVKVRGMRSAATV